MAVILVNAYSGTLFSYMAVPKLNPIVNTFEELAEKYPDQKPTIDANSVMAQLFLVLQCILGSSFFFSYSIIIYKVMNLTRFYFE